MLGPKFLLTIPICCLKTSLILDKEGNIISKGFLLKMFLKMGLNGVICPRERLGDVAGSSLVLAEVIGSLGRAAHRRSLTKRIG